MPLVLQNELPNFSQRNYDWGKDIPHWHKDYLRCFLQIDICLSITVKIEPSRPR